MLLYVNDKGMEGVVRMEVNVVYYLAETGLQCREIDKLASLKLHTPAVGCS